MTALNDYQRLEATGTYDPGTGTRPQDVVLSLGTATLTISNLRDRTAAHWSLAAVERRNPGEHPAVFAPAPDSTELLRTADDEMIRAIERVRSAVARDRPHPGRLRGRLMPLIGIAILVAAAIWLPGALTRKTASLVPDAARAEIGETLLGRIVQLTGQPCDNPEGVAALSMLMERLGEGGPPAASVLPDGVRTAVHLPGGRVLLGRSVVEDHESPAVVAGYILAEAERAATHDPLLPLLRHAGLAATAKLATTGRLPEHALDDYGAVILTAAPEPLDAAATARRFEAAGVPLAPYAYAVDITGEQTLPLIEADPLVSMPQAAVLPDGRWVALQGICGG